MNTVNELNEKLLAMKEAYDQLDAQKQAAALSEEQPGQTVGMFMSSYKP